MIRTTILLNRENYAFWQSIPHGQRSLVANYALQLIREDMRRRSPEIVLAEILSGKRDQTRHHYDEP
ncbi:MAG: hypothetical protein QXI02_02125 [Candidatus Caldarchaeum sp.]